MRAYLEAKRDDGRKAALEHWQAGTLDASFSEEWRGAVNTYTLLADLLAPDGAGSSADAQNRTAFEAIADFFDETEGPENAAEDDE